MKIYVASSWRNEFYPEVVETIRKAGFDVYDFRAPSADEEGFHWYNIGEDWLDWTPEEYRKNLDHPLARKQFKNDIEAMNNCDACVLVLPCGRSAHTEAGWFCGKGKKTIVYIPTKQEPELMYKLFSAVCCSMDEVINELRR